MSNRHYNIDRSSVSQIPVAPSDDARLAFEYKPVTKTKESTALNAQLLYVAASKYEGDWHSSMHMHSFSELFYVLGGNGDFFVGERKLEVRTDDLIIINPQIPHTEYSVGSSPLEYIVLGIEGLTFESGVPTQSAFTYISGFNRLCPARMYLETLLEEVQLDRPGRESMCQNLMNILLIYIQRQETLALSITSAKNASKECALVRRYIDDHFKEQVTLDDLASQAHLNKYYMAHAFKNAYGLSPINYLLEKRMEESKQLLSSTDLSLSQIAEIVGFSSASYFSQSFKRLSQISPIEYRHRSKQVLPPSSESIK